MTNRIVSEGVKVVTMENKTYTTEWTCDKCGTKETVADSSSSAIRPRGWQDVYRGRGFTKETYCPKCNEEYQALYKSRFYKELQSTLQEILEVFPDYDLDEGGVSYTIPNDYDGSIDTIVRIGELVREFNATDFKEPTK